MSPRTDFNPPTEADEVAAGSAASGEQAELQRQGAKAAARGEALASNPMLATVNQPDATGETEQVWSDRRDAWERGHSAQRSPSVTAGRSASSASAVEPRADAEPPTTAKTSLPSQDPCAPEDARKHRAAALLGRPFSKLDARAQRVAHHIGLRLPIAPQSGLDEAIPTAGQRAADAVTAFGGSWGFVGLFAAVMLGWVGLNLALVAIRGETFDPYPFILLNLFLSMLAAVQAPIILMSQNRQSEKDRLSAGHDYEINLKAELEIMLLHEKLDELRQQQWTELLTVQAEQIRLLSALAAALPGAGHDGARPGPAPSSQ